MHGGGLRVPKAGPMMHRGGDQERRRGMRWRWGCSGRFGAGVEGGGGGRGGMGEGRRSGKGGGKFK